MAGQTVILELPEAVYQWAERTARTTERAVESVLSVAEIIESVEGEHRVPL